MIIGYDKRPDGSIDTKLQSLIENIHLALNELDTNIRQTISKVTKSIQTIQAVVTNGDAVSNGKYLSKTVQLYENQMSPSESITLSLPSGSSGLIICCGAVATQGAEYIYNVTGTGTVLVSDVLTSSTTTYTKTTNQITITNGNSSYTLFVRIMVIRGEMPS